MFFPSALVAGVALLSTLQPIQGYLIDPESCSGDKYDFVKDTVQQAFAMAELAVSKVSPTMDQNATWLMSELFDLEGTAASKAVLGAFKSDGPNNKGDRTGVLSFKTEKKGDLDNLDQNEVVIFCDTKRLKRRLNDPLHYYDTKAKQLVGTTDGCGRAFMYTQTWSKHWSSIQVCPWFLEYAVAKKYHTSVNLGEVKAFLAVKGLDKFITDHKYTPIDLMTLWDKTMLHEMMHTTPGGLKEDIGGFAGYGWKNCKGLASNRKGLNNADSWALFASALYWFNQGSPIDETGSFVSPAMTQQQGIVRRWAGSGLALGASVARADAIKQFL